MKRRVPDTPTVERVLDAAENLVQTRGFNGFSYADIAAALGIRKASIHHHFATKAALGERLVERYTQRFQALLHVIDESADDATKALRRYTALYSGVLRDRNRMCLCGMMAAEISTLPRQVRKLISSFFDQNEKWLTALFERGRKARRIAFRGTAREAARRLVSSLEGAMLVARAYDDPKRFERHAAGLLTELKT